MGRRPGVLTLLVTALLGGGCGGGYVLRGTVVDAGYGALTFVSADQANQYGEPLAGVQVSVFRDPESLGRRLVASGRSGPTGAVEIPLAEFGVGWMDEVWLIEAHRSGYETVQQMVSLPSASKNMRLLITMIQGQGGEQINPDELWDQYEKFRQ